MNSTQRISVVTGGASGIGEGIVKRLVAEGAAVVLADIDDDNGRMIARELGSACVFHKCDVRSEADVDALIAVTVLGSDGNLLSS